jgi:hypothetical protein
VSPCRLDIKLNLESQPIPFIRIDALLLLIVWYLPFYRPPPNQVNEAWRIAATFIPISFGWAAGDVSLAAHIQSSLARVESKTTGVSALGAVMSFLYVLYVRYYSCLVTAFVIMLTLFYLDRHLCHPLSYSRKVCRHDNRWTRCACRIIQHRRCTRYLSFLQ